MGRIPWTAIRAYAKEEGVGDLERFRVLIRGMEEEHLELQRERREREGDA